MKLRHFYYFLLLVFIISPRLCQSDPVPKKGKKTAFGAGMLSGALAGAVVSNVLKSRANTGGGEQHHHHHHHHLSTDVNSPAAVAVVMPPPPPPVPAPQITIHNGEIMANGCFEQTIRVPNPRDVRQFEETVHLVCKSVPAPVNLPSPLPPQVPVEYMRGWKPNPMGQQISEPLPSSQIPQLPYAGTNHMPEMAALPMEPAPKLHFPQPMPQEVPASLMRGWIQNPMGQQLAGVTTSSDLSLQAPVPPMNPLPEIPFPLHEIAKLPTDPVPELYFPHPIPQEIRGSFSRGWIPSPTDQQISDEDIFESNLVIPTIPLPEVPNSPQFPLSEVPEEHLAHFPHPAPQKPLEPLAHLPHPSPEKPHEPLTHLPHPAPQKPHEPLAHLPHPAPEEPHEPLAHLPHPDPQKPHEPLAHLPHPTPEKPHEPLAHLLHPEPQKPYEPLAHLLHPAPQKPYEPLAHLPHPAPQIPFEHMTHLPHPAPQKPHEPLAHLPHPEPQIPFEHMAHLPHPAPQKPYEPLAHLPHPEPQVPFEHMAHLPHPTPQKPHEPLAHLPHPEPQVPFEHMIHLPQSKPHTPLSESGPQLPRPQPAHTQISPTALPVPVAPVAPQVIVLAKKTGYYSETKSSATNIKLYNIYLILSSTVLLTFLRI